MYHFSIGCSDISSNSQFNDSSEEHEFYDEDAEIVLDEYDDESSETTESDGSGIELSESSKGDEESKTEDDAFLIKHAKKPLYQGTPLTVAEHILSVLSLLLTCKFTEVDFSRILRLLYNHCIQPNYCVKSLHKFRKFF